MKNIITNHIQLQQKHLWKISFFLLKTPHYNHFRISVSGVYFMPWLNCLLVRPVSEGFSVWSWLFFTIFHRALKAGSQSPLLVTIAGDTFTNAWSVSVLGALHALYVVGINRVDIQCYPYSSYGFSVLLTFFLVRFPPKNKSYKHKRLTKNYNSCSIEN